MTLSISQHFGRGWTTVVSGTGSVSNSTDGKTLTTISNGQNNGAMKEWYFQASPGDIIEVSIWGRAVDGTPRVGIDIRNSSNSSIKVIGYEDISGGEFKLYRISAVVPEYIQNISCAALVIGGWSSNTVPSNGQFMEPSIEIKSKEYGFLQPIAFGMVRMVNGSADVHPGFKNKGISSVGYDSATNELIVTIESSIITNSRPIMLATGTPDHNESVLAGKFSGNSFRVAFTSGAGKVPLTAGSWYANVVVFY